MKILKIFGIVVGIHVFALILIFANPGCSSTKKTPPAATATTSPPEASPVASAPSTSSSVYSSTTDSTSSVPPVSFNPNTPAGAAPGSSSTGRYAPTRPGTPVAGALNTEPVKGVTPATPYTVKAGDNLSTIARKNNVTLAQLTSANNLSTNTSLRPGQKLLIPGKPTSSSDSPAASGSANLAAKSPIIPAPAASSQTGADVMKHVVKSGETLGGIARKYDVRQGDIAVANNITDPKKIRPGMELVIPDWQAPGSKSGKSAQKSSGAAKSTPSSSTAPAASTPVPAEPIPTTQLEPTTTAPVPTVPVIRIDESSATPAPKQP
jgi:LysM repeat protein